MTACFVLYKGKKTHCYKRKEFVHIQEKKKTA
jgi:hypothetical protein